MCSSAQISRMQSTDPLWKCWRMPSKRVLALTIILNQQILCSQNKEWHDWKVYKLQITAHTWEMLPLWSGTKMYFWSLWTKLKMMTSAVDCLLSVSLKQEFIIFFHVKCWQLWCFLGSNKVQKRKFVAIVFSLFKIKTTVVAWANFLFVIADTFQTFQ